MGGGDYIGPCSATPVYTHTNTGMNFVKRFFNPCMANAL